MKNHQIIGVLFILGAIGVFVPYTVLTLTFDYPDILRQDVGIILTKFHEGGTNLIFTWWLFAILGIPLLIAYKLLSKELSQNSDSINWLTTIGIIGLVTQIVGLLRWPFVVPILAQNYISGDDTSKEISSVIFQVVHQYAGVVLGEHLGQLFTIIWVIGITKILQSLKLVPAWITWLGYLSSSIYLLAQAELFATIIPTFPVWDVAGFIGSTLWLIWLVSLGIVFFLKR